MLSHDHPLRRRQVRAFLQDFVRHGNLAEIVQEPAPAQRYQFFVAQTQMPSQLRRILRQPLAMPDNVRLFHLSNSYLAFVFVAIALDTFVR